MPNKEVIRTGMSGSGAGGTAVGAVKSSTSVGKPNSVKVEMASPPRPPRPAAGSGSPAPEASELLGSLTTEQQQRTSARVIKKLRLDCAPEDDKRDEALDKLEADKSEADKDGGGEAKGPGGKQRMPKALWSSDEKTLFFEALNEYGKDFDAITDYIRAKMKRKGSSGKTKSQVSHFYYRTWHKLAKYTSFGENVKKVAQELYALINYGEMRRKMSAGVKERTCSRLQELIIRGTVLLRARGRSLRLRTPQCRALRCLNHIGESSVGMRIPTRLTVVLKARSAAAWARVQSAAHNPRISLSAPLRVLLSTMLAALSKRWDVRRKDSPPSALHVGPRAGLALHAPGVAGEPPQAHKICFTSYLERMSHEGNTAKIRTPKRQRKDSGTERDSCEKRARGETDEKCGLDIDDMAIDGIELMANLTERDCKNQEPNELKPELTEDLKAEEVPEDTDTDDIREDAILDTEREADRDSLSEEENYDTIEPKRPTQKFRNLKVKFRVRTKKNSDAREYTLVPTPTRKLIETEAKSVVIADKSKADENVPDVKNYKSDKPEAIAVKKEEVLKKDDIAEKKDEVVVKKDEGEAKKEEEEEKEEVPAAEKRDERLEMARKQMASGWSLCDAGDLTLGDLYLMFGSESRLELDYWWAPPSAPMSPAGDARLSGINVPDIKPLDVKIADKPANSEEASDSELLSPRPHQFSHDSNDALSGDERKRNEDGGAIIRLTDKLINRADSTPHHHELMTVTSRLRRLLALATSGGGGAGAARGGASCVCGHVCPQNKRRPAPTQEAPRYPTHGNSVTANIHSASNQICLDDIPKRRRGRPVGRTDRVVVQRLLPLLPKPSNSAPHLIPVTMSQAPPPTPVAILPRPPAVTVAKCEASYIYMIRTEDEAKEPTAPIKVPAVHSAGNKGEPAGKDDIKEEPMLSEGCSQVDVTLPMVEGKSSSRDNFTGFLSQESLSIPCLSPSRLLREDGAWLERDVTDFSLSSFLGHLEGAAPHANVDTQLQCMMQESSIDYMAKFADLAAEVASERDGSKN